jgi:hypothetical protein
MLNKECLFAEILQSMLHGKIVIKNFVKNISYKQCCLKEYIQQKKVLNDKITVASKENMKR